MGYQRIDLALIIVVLIVLTVSIVARFMFVRTVEYDPCKADKAINRIMITVLLTFISIILIYVLYNERVMISYVR